MKASVPKVDEIATIIVEAIDQLSANKTSKEEVIEIISDIVSDTNKRLKVLDGNEAKPRFAAIMGKGRLGKFYPLLLEAEK